jgi:hypothetical protein
MRYLHVPFTYGQIINYLESVLARFPKNLESRPAAARAEHNVFFRRSHRTVLMRAETLC